MSSRLHRNDLPVGGGPLTPAEREAVGESVRGAVDGPVFLATSPTLFVGETRAWIATLSRHETYHTDTDCSRFPEGPVTAAPLGVVERSYDHAPCPRCVR